MNEISLSEATVSRSTTTSYEFAEGYRPTVTELYASRFPNYVVSRVVITEFDDSHDVSLYGRQITKAGAFHSSDLMIVVAHEIEEELYRQHKEQNA